VEIILSMSNNFLSEIKMQKTFVMIKPDGVKRGLTGEIISRIERAGLKIIGLKMIEASQEQIKKHYPIEDMAWVERLGNKGLSSFAKMGQKASDHVGTDDVIELGQIVINGIVQYMTSGPVICLAVEGVQAIPMMRKMVGDTFPVNADVGTIRGDYSVDSGDIALIERRSVHNLVHASEVLEEAKNELSIWFNKNELVDYTLGNGSVMYSKFY
jgi:nucleoside-diphosphate kinase